MARAAALRVLLVVAAAVAAVLAVADARESDRDRIARERLVWQVVAEHTDALNRCDLRRVMAQHPYVFCGGGGEGGGAGGAEGQEREEKLGGTAVLGVYGCRR